MLNKKFCKRCKGIWEDIDERRWNHGHVHCPYEDYQAKQQREISAYGLYGYVCASVDFGMETKYRPPEDCPYLLEQIIHAQ